MRTDSDPVIDVRGVTREFRVEPEPRTLFRVLRESVTGRGEQPARRKALCDVGLIASRGDKIAIVGNNGAGKSTLLKIVAGLLRPTAGSVHVHGEAVLLTALGVGMIDEVSVLDNTLMYGALYGVDPGRMRTDFAEILEWSGITGYEHAKLRTLSTGMRARLAFSVIRYVAADIFLIDEALSAGDGSFRAKTRAFFDAPRNDQRTFLVVTHDLDFARSFCTRAVWLHEGRVKAFGESISVIAQYVAAESSLVLAATETARKG